MRWLKIVTLSIIALALSGVITSSKAAYIKSGKNIQKQQGIRIGSKDDKYLPVEEPVDKSLSRMKQKLALVVSVKEKDAKEAKRNKNKHDIREKLMKSLLENGEVKNVNSHGLTSEEASEKTRLDSKHEELWALIEAMTARKNKLKEEMKNSYNDQSGIGPNDRNIINDYTDQKEYLGDDSHGSDGSRSVEIVDELRNKGKKHKLKMPESDEDISSIEKLPASLGKFLSPSSIKRLGLLETPGHFDDVGSEQEEISREEKILSRKKHRKKSDKVDPDFYNVNVKFSKLITDNMKDLHNMESLSRKKKKTKRHLEGYDKTKDPIGLEKIDEKIDGKRVVTHSSLDNVAMPLQDHENSIRKQKLELSSQRKNETVLQDEGNDNINHYPKEEEVKEFPQHKTAKPSTSPTRSLNKSKPNKKYHNNGENKVQKEKGVEKKGRHKGKATKHYYIDLKSLEDYIYHNEESPKLQKNVKKSDPFLQKAKKYNSGKKSHKKQPAAHGSSKSRHVESKISTISSNDLTEGKTNNFLSKEMSNLDAKMENLETKVNRTKFKPKDQRRNSEHQETNIEVTGNHIPSEPFKLSGIILGNDIEKSHNKTNDQFQESKDELLNNSSSNLASVPRKTRSASSSKTKKRQTYKDAYESEEYNDDSSPETDTPVRNNPKSVRSIPFNWYDFNRYMRTSEGEDYRISDLLKKYFHDQRSNEESSEIYSQNQKEQRVNEGQRNFKSSSHEDYIPPIPTQYEKPLPPEIAPVEVPKSGYGVNMDKIANEFNEAVENSKVLTVIPEKSPIIEPQDSENPDKKDEQFVYLKRKNGIRIPLRLVQDEDGNCSIQLDMKYVCRKCTKQRLKKRRHQKMVEPN